MIEDRPPPEVVKLRRLEKKLARARQARDEARRELSALKEIAQIMAVYAHREQRDAWYKLCERFNVLKDTVHNAVRVASGLEKEGTK